MISTGLMVSLVLIFFYSSDVIDLVLLCSVSSLSSTALNEGLKLMVKILRLSDESPHDHLTVLAGQVCVCVCV